jgi:MFS family permease
MPEVSDVSLFVAAAIIGGAIAQYPVGLLSDRYGRPRILVLLSFLSVITCLALALFSGRLLILVLVTLFGAVAMPMYALALATVIDKAKSGEFVLVGTSVLLLNATGAALAPLFIGPLMDAASVSMLWWSLAITSGLIGFYIFLHRSDVENVKPEDQAPFTVAAPEIAPQRSSWILEVPKTSRMSSNLPPRDRPMMKSPTPITRRSVWMILRRSQRRLASNVGANPALEGSILV